MTLAPRLTPLTPSDASAFGVEIACHEGYYNSVETPINTTELTRCTRCPDHSTTNHTGAVDASACHCRTGFTETHTANGSLVCECAAGFGIDEADDLCERCEIGKHKSEVGNHKCVECPLSADGQPVMTTVARGAVGLDDCECQPGFYRDFEAHLANGNHTCFACPRGTECAEAGVHLTELPIAPGYWRATLTTYHVRECYNPDACEGGVNLTELCAEGYEGPYCSVCADGYTPSAGDGCSRCDGDVYLLFLPAAVVLLLMLLLCACVLCRAKRSTLASAAAAVGTVTREGVDEALKDDETTGLFGALFKRLAKLAVKVRILVSLAQVLTSLGVVFDMPHLPFYDSIMRVLALVQLDFVQALPLSCAFSINFHISLLLRTLVPLFVMLALCTMELLHLWRLRALHRAAKRHISQQAAKRSDSVHAKARRLAGSASGWLAQQGTTAAFFILFLIYPNTSSAILSVFQCIRLEDGNSYLRADFSIHCDTWEHTLASVYAAVMALVYPVGVPCLYAAMFRAYRLDLATISELEALQESLRKGALAEAALERDGERAAQAHSSKLRKQMSMLGAEAHSAMAHSFFSRRSAGGDDAAAAPSAEAAAGEEKLPPSPPPSPPPEVGLDASVEAKLAALKAQELAARKRLPNFMRRLIQGYEMRVYHFEILECGRKLALVGVPVFFETGSLAQMAYGLLVAFVAFGLYASSAPYTDTGDDRLASLCQMQIFLALLGTIILRFDDDDLNSQNIDTILSVCTFMPLALAIYLETPLADWVRENATRENARRLVGKLRRRCMRTHDVRPSRAAAPAQHSADAVAPEATVASAPPGQVRV